jgi:hypothetical protein
MTDKEQNRSEVHQEPTSKDITGMNFQGKDRRRFIKRAIVAAPFILTVTSQPVWAKNCSLSGQLSGNISPADGPCGGEGCSPGYWKNHIDMWHNQFPPDKPFYEVFGVDAFPGSTLHQVIAMFHKDCPNVTMQAAANCTYPLPGNYYNMLRKLGFHSVAALQNAATAVSFDLTVDEVITIFVNAYNDCIITDMEKVKDDLDWLNNQVCPF